MPKGCATPEAGSMEVGGEGSLQVFLMAYLLVKTRHLGTQIFVLKSQLITDVMVYTCTLQILELGAE